MELKKSKKGQGHFLPRPSSKEPKKLQKMKPYKNSKQTNIKQKA
jgi:hypothetical protein